MILTKEQLEEIRELCVWEVHENYIVMLIGTTVCIWQFHEPIQIQLNVHEDKTHLMILIKDKILYKGYILPIDSTIVDIWVAIKLLQRIQHFKLEQNEINTETTKGD